MIAVGLECRHERACHFSAVTGALFEQLRECRFDAAEILQPGAHVGQMPGRQPCGHTTLQPIIKPQQLPDFLQVEAQPLR